MWVVKIGGSLSESDDLSAWLDVLAVLGRGQVVIVPGGGPFADQVRRSQARWGFDDVAAHHMALLAMEQYGRMLAGIRPEFKCTPTLAEIRQALSDRHVPVWLPSQLAGCAQDVPASWDLTSDSLAAWLANALAAECLILLKSVQPTESVVSAAALADCGLVDPLFPAFTSHARYEIRLMGKDQHPLMRVALLTGELRGTEVATIATRCGVRMQ
jgi:aspartokinase-like uncharacterized kinase